MGIDWGAMIFIVGILTIGSCVGVEKYQESMYKHELIIKNCSESD